MIKKESIDLFIDRFEQLDKPSVKNYVFRLARQCTFYENILNESIFDGVIVLSEQLEIEFANKSAYELLGLPSNIVGEKMHRFLKEVNWQTIKEDINSFQKIEIFYPQHRYINLHTSVACSQVGEKNITLIFHDRTDELERNKLNFEEEKINALTMLAGGVAHEIGNPLNSLSINLQLLQRLIQKNFSEKDVNEAQETISVARQEISRLDGIIKQFLDAIRNTHPILVPQDVKKLVKESLVFLKKELTNKQITVETYWQDRVPLIKGDATQLKQVFYNIIKNASQAMINGGEFVVSIIEESNFLKITFADSGGGMVPKQLGKIFDCFKTDKNSGTGLGLFIVSRIMREHKGRVDVGTNEFGTTFSLYFPLRETGHKLISVDEDRKND